MLLMHKDAGNGNDGDDFDEDTGAADAAYGDDGGSVVYTC